MKEEVVPVSDQALQEGEKREFGTLILVLQSHWGLSPSKG